MDAKQTEIVKDAEVILKGIELEMNPQNQDEVKRIRFKTDKGDITWKPKMQKTQLMDGLKIQRTQSMELGDLPKKLSTWGTQLSDVGSIKLKIQYTKMVADVDGCDTVYRFITAEKTFDRWEEVKSSSNEDEIIETPIIK